MSVKALSSRGLCGGWSRCASSRCFGSELLSRLVYKGVSMFLTEICFVDELMTELPSADIMSSNSEHGSRSRLMAWNISVGFYAYHTYWSTTYVRYLED